MTKQSFPYIKQSQAYPFHKPYSSSPFLLAWPRQPSFIFFLLLAKLKLGRGKRWEFGYYYDQDIILKHKLEAFLHSLHVRGRDEAILAKVKLVKEKKVGTLRIILIKKVFSL